jgi:hypothetical protein
VGESERSRGLGRPKEEESIGSWVSGNITLKKICGTPRQKIIGG